MWGIVYIHHDWWAVSLMKQVSTRYNTRQSTPESQRIRKLKLMTCIFQLSGVNVKTYNWLTQYYCLLPYTPHHAHDITINLEDRHSTVSTATEWLGAFIIASQQLKGFFHEEAVQKISPISCNKIRAIDRRFAQSESVNTFSTHILTTTPQPMSLSSKHIYDDYVTGMCYQRKRRWKCTIAV